MLIPLKDYANSRNLDYSWLRRLASANRLNAKRIGNNWFIEESTPLPPDNYHKCGYRFNDGTTIEPSSMNSRLKDLDILDEL